MVVLVSFHQMFASYSLHSDLNLFFLTSTGKSKKTKKGSTSANVEVPEASDVEEVEEITQTSLKV